MMELDATRLYVLRRHVGLPQIYGEAPAAVQAAKAYSQRQVRTVADMLADGRTWLLGEGFTGADLLLASCLGMAQPYGLPLDGTLTAFRERAMARPAYAMAAQANRAENWQRTG